MALKCDKCGNRKRKLSEIEGTVAKMVFGTPEPKHICSPCLQQAARIAEIMGGNNLEEESQDDFLSLEETLKNMKKYRKQR